MYILGLFKDEDIDWLVAVGQTDSVTAGEAFDSVYILLEGTLRVSIVEQQDKELAWLGPGEMVGEISMLDSHPPSATVTATTDVQVLRVPRTDLVAKLINRQSFFGTVLSCDRRLSGAEITEHGGSAWLRRRPGLG